MIEITNLTKIYGDQTVLDGVDLTINEGDRIAIIGSSGSGKSTFLRCINCMEDPDGGTIMFEGVNLADFSVDINLYRQKIGMVFQQFNLFNNKTIIDNITLSPDHVAISKERKLRRNNFLTKINNAFSKTKKVLLPTTSYKEIKEKNRVYAGELLQRIGLSDKANCYPPTLSGGQKQRIAIIRALAMRPKVLLFDEPTSALDVEMVKEVLDLIKELAESGLTFLIVTHELNFAKKIATKVLFMDKGKIIESGTPDEVFNRPQSLRLQEFLAKVDDF